MAVIISVIVAPALVAQSSIAGVVKDSTGRVLPDVRVAITDAECQQRWETRTSALGEYIVKRLAPGAYTVVVDVPFYARVITSVVTSRRRSVDLDIELVPRPSDAEQAVPTDTPVEGTIQLPSPRPTERRVCP